MRSAYLGNHLGVMFGVLSIQTAVATPTSDYVPSLPGYGKPPTPQYSGFLNASKAEPGTMLHYWFAAAKSESWSQAPLIVWFNGGPGSSSVLGMLQEQGPLIIDKAGKLVDNPYAWTSVANFMVLESPAGVGYSYCAAMNKGGSCVNSDVSTAKAAHAALEDFFTTKFPELRANPFFITGESYAGVYCPTLAAEIVAANAAGGAPINLVGMAVGDPCTDNKAQKQSMDMLWYAHKYGLVAGPEYSFLSQTCGYEQPAHLAAGEWRAAANGSVLAATPGGVHARPRDGAPAGCVEAFRKYLLGSSKGISQSWEKAYINELSFYSPAGPYRFDVPGTFNYRTAQFMNDPATRLALHVHDAPHAKSPTAWPGPTAGWSYHSSYDACNGAAKPDDPRSMIDFYRSLAPALTGKLVVYNGDTDPCVSYEGTREAIRQVGFNVTQPARPWFFNFSSATTSFLERKDVLFGGLLSPTSAGAQYGGEVRHTQPSLPARPPAVPNDQPACPTMRQVTDYEHGLSFVTVHGSGHMVPTFRPRAALQLIAHVVNNASFAPAVPPLGAMSDDDFDKFLDKWVVAAKSSSFVSARTSS